MIIFNGYRDDEERVHQVKPRKADNGHSVVKYITRRRGSSFNFKYTIVCECDKVFNSRQSMDSVIYRYDAHQRQSAS